MLLILISWDRNNTKRYWEKMCGDANLPVCAVNDLAEVFEEPQVKHNQIVQEVHHSKAGTLRFPAAPVRLNKKRLTIHSAPPTLGEHTNDVLKDLGYTMEEIDRLRAQNVV